MPMTRGKCRVPGCEKFGTAAGKRGFKNVCIGHRDARRKAKRKAALQAAEKEVTTLEK